MIKLLQIFKYLLGHSALCAVLSLTSQLISPIDLTAQESSEKAIPPVFEFEQSELEDLAEKTSELKSATHWKLLANAQLQDRLGNYSSAKKLYEQIPKFSAASLDALIQMSRLDSGSCKTCPAFDELMGRATQAKRSDLLAQIHFLKALNSEAKNDIIETVRYYQELREKFPDTVAAETGKARQPKIQELKKTAESENALSDLLAKEVELLLLERQSESAQRLLSELYNRTAKNSDKYFQAKLLEEKVLRQSGETELADSLLEQLRKIAPSTIAAKILEQMIKKAWNANDTEQALALGQDFFSRFPNSEQKQNVRYMLARVHEELDQTKEASELYKKIRSDGLTSLFSARALRQLAWISARGGNTEPAARYMNELTVMSLDLYNKLKQDSLTGPIEISVENEILDSVAHSRYWLGSFIKRSDAKAEEPKERYSIPGINYSSEQSVWEELVQLRPRDYYSALARKSLKTAGNKPINTPETRCDELPTLAAELSNSLTELKSFQLINFAEYEIHWSLRNILDSNPKESILADLNRARLLAFAGQTNRSIAFAERAIRRSDRLKNKDQLIPTNCLDEMIKLSHPDPYREIFQKNAKLNNLPVGLITALSRTESHFDPNARSGKDAMGLLQLLQSTAKSEGLEPGQDLFDPETNIALGAKHLARLIQNYGGEKIYAIAAYNAGSKAVDRWRARFPGLDPTAWVEHIGYPETKNYVKKVIASEMQYSSNKLILDGLHSSSPLSRTQ